MRDCAQGLSFLHLNRTIMRYLDPDHVMVCPGPSGEVCFKLRPGSKFALSEEENESSISVRVAAPELFNSGRFTPESDVWSLGVLSWTILSKGEPLYWGLTDGQVLEAVRGGWRLPLPGAQFGAKDALHTVMLQCWEARPNQRPRAKEIQFKFEQILAETTTTTKESNIPGIPV